MIVVGFCVAAVVTVVVVENKWIGRLANRSSQIPEFLDECWRYVGVYVVRDF